nr:hypothetical protein [uncultured Prevotella sp.]
MKKKIYTNPLCEVVPFADEVLLSAATDPKNNSTTGGTNTGSSDNPSDGPGTITIGEGGGFSIGPGSGDMSAGEQH